MGLPGSCRQLSSQGSVSMLLQTLVTGASVIRRLHPGVRSIFVYRSAAAQTRGRWLAWLVQAEFRGLRRFSSALREAVAPETVRRTRRQPHALARLSVPVTIRRPLIKARCGGKARNGRAPAAIRVPSRRRPPSVLPAPATSLQPSPPPPPPVKDQIDRSK
jgi:hypothetical protein